ncbi:Crp/Fnr family transcriptional regulator [Kitasatospora cineracea]|uniref:Crp/Fnr family transcriptional regulator n=1 Tax=Kitasatospora cineracea TaxID=88074 RepID=UPI00380ABD5B
MDDGSNMDGRSSYLRFLPVEARGALERIGRVRKFTSGEVLIEEGDERREMWLLVEGRAKVTRRLNGRTASLVDLKVAGDVLGEIAAMDCGPRTATVTACCAGEARVVPRPDLQLFLREHPEALTALHQVLGERLRRSDRRRLEFGTYPVLVRLARVLVELAASYGAPARNAIRIEVSLSQSEFASLTGSRTNTVHKALAELRRRELISTGERQTHIHDLPGLRRAALLSMPPGPPRGHPSA